ncbi:MAG: YkvA family protein [Candidatus Limnocylindria bacterium]
MRKRFRPPRDLGAAIEAVRKLPAYGRLVWGLLRDGRVPAQQKLILVGIVGYLLVPLDLIPDFLPVIGQLDDLAVVLLGLDLFIRATPKEIMDQHLARISRKEDDLKRDMEQVQHLLGDRFAGIRANLEKILDRQRARFRSPDDAGEALAKWQERHDEHERKGGAPHGAA